MADTTSPRDRFIEPETVARRLGVDVETVLALVTAGEIRGVRIGMPPVWRIARGSVEDYLDDQAENARRAALWRQSQTASFPELWGRGDVRTPD